MTSATKYPNNVGSGDITAIYGKLPSLPDWVPPSADDLNDLSDASRNKQEVASPTTPLPVVYGRDRVPGKIAVVHVDDTNGFLYLMFTFAEPCTAIDKVFVDNIDVDDATDGIIAKGGEVEMFAAGLVLSTLLAAVIPGYADTPAACNVVLKCPKEYQRTFPKVEAIVQGRAVYDPRSTLTAYSDNPSLCFANMAAQAGWGVNWTSVEEAADFNDELVGGVKRRTIGLTLADPRPAEDWAKVFRVYTGCFLNWENGELKMTPDVAATLPTDVVRTFSADDIVAGSITMRRRNPSSFPTTVIVEYRDSSDDDNWTTERAVYEQPGVASHRVSRVSLPGIHNYAQAYREAKERQKKFLADLTVEMTAFDEGLDLLVGSVVRVLHPIGLDGYFRVASMGTDQGRWRLGLSQYEDVYSNDAPTAPTRYTPSVGSPDSVITFRDTVFGVVTDTIGGGTAKKFIGEELTHTTGWAWGARHALSKDGSTLVVHEAEWMIGSFRSRMRVYTSADNFSAVQATLEGGYGFMDPANLASELDISDDGSIIVLTESETIDAAVFVYHGTNWGTTTLLPIPSAAPPGYYFWGGVAISGDGTVIAARGTNFSEDRIFVYYGTSWATETVLASPDFGADEHLQGNMDLSGDGSVLVIGAYADGFSTQKAIVYHGTLWGSTTVLGHSFPDTYWYPLSLSVSGDGATIAATGWYGSDYQFFLQILSGTSWGTSYTYTMDASSPGGEYATYSLEAVDGVSISADGTAVALAVPQSHGVEATEGSSELWLFRRSGGTWSRTAVYTADVLFADYPNNFMPDNASAYVVFGETGIHISGDGTLILAGGYWGPNYDPGDGIAKVPVVLLDLDVARTVVSVVPTITILGVTGLTGGGDLTANREITLDFDGLTVAPALTPGSDVVAVYRPSGDAHYKVPLLDLPGTKTTITTQTDNYTLAATDLYVRMDSATPVNLTVPDNTTVPIPVGYIKAIRQVGAGQVTLVPGSGVTLNSTSSLTTRTQDASISVVKVATNEWDVTGDLE